MKRAVITGLGIVSCIGNDQETILHNLKNLNDINFNNKLPINILHYISIG